MEQSFITGEISLPGISVPQVSARLRPIDFLGAVMVRWGFNRDNYKVNPGLYAVGSPGASSEVFVTANYKLSFDTLRKNLSGIDAWILVLDTKGINVWCAAGKGTFGTKELIRRIYMVSLDKIVNHKRLILPQLGATGVAAYRVKEKTGFIVNFGPVRAGDIKKFINKGFRAEREMRKVTFRLSERIKLIPNDFMYGKYYLLGAAAVLFLLSGINKSGISYKDYLNNGVPAILNVLLAYMSGIIVTPVLLPYIPVRYFSLKGFISGSLVFFLVLLTGHTGSNIIEKISWFFIFAAASSFLAMNFTGSSTYTSISGVKKEMKIFLPLEIGFSVTGIILQIIGKLI